MLRPHRGGAVNKYPGTWARRMRTAEEVLESLRVENAGKVAEILRDRAWARGVRLDYVEVEDAIRVLPGGEVRFVLGGVGSVIVDPKTLQVVP